MCARGGGGSRPFSLCLLSLFFTALLSRPLLFSTALSLSGYANVVIGGGSTLIPNLPERLTRDIALKANAACQPAVCAPPERLHSAWVGGSILGSLAVAGTMWVSKAEYDENGPLIVHRKCF